MSFLNSISKLLVIFLFIFSQCLLSQNNSSVKPKLVVGIVVDQMRNDYIYRYWNRFGEGGFKRLINDGFYFKNAHYNYIPTYTGPGHSSIYTGATPRTHAIIANDWHIKSTTISNYCVSDTGVKSIGCTNKNGKMSPKNQLSSSIGDELKISTNQMGKVFSIAIKDRSAILPAGHAANGAFWYDEITGNFISSSWYIKELPSWVNAFNNKNFPKVYLTKGWQTLYPISSYSNSLADNNNYEASPVKKAAITFPYNYKDFIEKNDFSIIKSNPYGNTITKDLAISCLINESLGKDNIPDLLCISFSSPDYIGHYYGPRSIEAEDIYLRLDKDIEDLLKTLDEQVGKNNYTIFLTADHGGADVPNHLIDYKIPAGYIKEKYLVTEIKKFLQRSFGDSSIFENNSNEQIFLDARKINQLNLKTAEVESKLADFLITINGISEAFTSSTLKTQCFYKNDYPTLLQNGYNHKLSGNVCYIYNPAWMDYSEKGTTHGAGYNYDTHVPIIFYGNGIKKGNYFQYVSITQIAPTICELLQINQTNGCISDPLNEFFISK
jgi:predicted AlkP superfamily pyrophosphatase or phosphodiesterase